MDKKSIGKQIAAIALLVIGLVSVIFGVFGLVGGGSIEPYEARQGVVLVYATATVYNEDGSVEQTGGTGTGWAIVNRASRYSTLSPTGMWWKPRIPTPECIPT